MLQTRIILVLLLKDGRLVKGERFKRHKYIGEPINAVKIFNEKAVDEIVLLDISATSTGAGPDLGLLGQIVDEAFIPLSYGGGITSLEHARKLFRLGVEKVILCTSAVKNPDLVEALAMEFGSQSVSVCIEVKKNFWGRSQVSGKNGTENTGIEPTRFAQKMASLGAGELIVSQVERDGTCEGYNVELLKKIASNVTIPVVALGGARGMSDFEVAIQHGQVSGVAAGRIFTLTGPHKAPLISYPSKVDRDNSKLK